MSNKIKVMVIDDEYMILEGLCYLLKNIGTNIEICFSSESVYDSIHYFKNHEVDVVLTDICMPDMDGLSMIKEMKSISSKVSFIVMSGYQEFEYAKQAIDIGVLSYLVKPIDKYELENIFKMIDARLSLEKSKELLLLQEVDISDIFSTLEGQYLIAHRGLVTSYSTVKYTINQLDISISISDKKNVDDVIFFERITTDTNLRKFLGTVEKALFYNDFYQDANSVSSPSYIYQYEKLIRCKSSELPIFFENMIHDLKNTLPNINDVKNQCIQFITDCYRHFIDSEIKGVSLFIQDVNNSQTFQELVDVIQEQLDYLLIHIRYSPHVLESIEIIQNEYKEELSLKILSERLYLNSVYLGQVIKRETGLTFSELLNEKRVSCAQKLLISTKKGIEEICYDVGYTNVGYFYKTFKKICGYSPRSYREKYIK